MAIKIVALEERSYFLPGRAERKKTAVRLKEEVIARIGVTLPGEDIPADYPWCFVLPAANRKDYLFGALNACEKQEESCPVFAFYAQVNQQWLSKNLQSDFHLAFWLARITLALQNKSGVIHAEMTLRKWLNALQCSYAPIKEFLLNDRYKFANNADLLLSGLCRYDEKLTEKEGVSVMPWQGWPDCVQADKQAWLWRQSRYGKIIDSQKFLL